MDLVSSFLSKKNINNEEDIKFENYIKGEAKLNSEKQYIIESSCCFDGNKDNFKRHYDENKILEIHLNNMLFEQYLSFDNVKKLSLIINDNVKFDKLFINNCNELYLKFNGRVEVIDKININNCKFKQISINNHIDGNIEFQKCNFNDFNLSGLCDVVIKGDFKFNFCEVKEIANFMNFKFKNKVYFKMSKFKDNVYFNNSHFYDYANFHECEFEKTANFHECEFEKAPNFSQAIFKGNLNTVNTNLNFDFENLKEKINQECEEFNKNKKEEDEKSLDKFANDFRDSFRIFKNALIKDNNLLDASNFHKYELYCKEIELKQSWNKLKNVTTDEDIKQNNRNHSQLVDFLLLGFYRKLCDHHTDLLRVFNNLILLISLYVLYNFFILYISGKEIINDTKIYLSDIFHNNIFWYIPGILLFICVCSIYFCKNKEKTHVINREIKIKKFQWCKIIIKEILNFLFVCMICYMGISIFGIVGDFLAKFFGLKIFKDVVYISFACLSFFGLFLFFINSLVLRYIFISFSYFVVAFVLFLKPKEFYFIYNIFKDDDKNLAIMSSLNVVYFTLIILVLFSLQKTARKNSIVPS
ncbi:pentapeptide repeat-containing protein [Campylobacter sp. RM10541]|uniref:pentapeptide repeat-containing protein n=1 Tax=Campylobacter molothri TaxID=1032242 RepID=UPI001DC7C744|nr:pentapeptide repeat-containing protein [Campylobacter sp. RM10536]MBZ7956588.1 pentapeptide repeat-containing protein [Campylobacter sp. RM10541]